MKIKSFLTFKCKRLDKGSEKNRIEVLPMDEMKTQYIGTEAHSIEDVR